MLSVGFSTPRAMIRAPPPRPLKFRQRTHRGEQRGSRSASFSLTTRHVSHLKHLAATRLRISDVKRSAGFQMAAQMRDGLCLYLLPALACGGARRAARAEHLTVSIAHGSLTHRPFLMTAEFTKPTGRFPWPPARKELRPGDPSSARSALGTPWI